MNKPRPGHYVKGMSTIEDAVRELYCAGYALAVEQAIELLSAVGHHAGARVVATMRERVAAIHASVVIEKAAMKRDSS